MLSTVIYCSNYSFSSFWAFCEVSGVDIDEVNKGGIDEDEVCGAKYCCMIEWTILTRSWTCYSEKPGTNESASGILIYWVILKADRWSIERIDLIIIIAN